MQSVTSIIADPLDDFHKNLPNRPYCSNNKRIKYIKHRDAALEMPYIQVNHAIVNYIVFDLDYQGSALAARDNDLAEPTITAINRDNGHCHAIYQIDPIYPKTASIKSRTLLKDIIDGYKDILKADRVITTQKQLIKNPLHQCWETITGEPVTLSEMAEYLPYGRQYNKQHPNWTPWEQIGDFSQYISIGRNCTMFDFLRHYAYSIVNDCQSQDELNNSIFMLAAEKNIAELLKWFRTPLKQKELDDITKSISRWTWAHRGTLAQRTKNNGVMGFEPRTGKYIPPAQFEAETKRRQANGGAYAARQRILNQLADEGIIL